MNTVEGLETERSPLRPRACGIVYLLTSNSTSRRLHLLNAVLKLYYSTGASLNIRNDSVMHFRSFSRKRNINTLVTVTVTVLSYPKLQRVTVVKPPLQSESTYHEQRIVPTTEFMRLESACFCLARPKSAVHVHRVK